MKYILRNSPVEAFQMTKERFSNRSEWPEWLVDAIKNPDADLDCAVWTATDCRNNETRLVVDIGDHAVFVCPGDYIVKDTTGSFSVLFESLFEEEYVQTEDPPVDSPGKVKVMTFSVIDGERKQHVLDADHWEIVGGGIQFSKAGVVVAWFLEWKSVEVVS